MRIYTFHAPPAYRLCVLTPRCRVRKRLRQRLFRSGLRLKSSFAVQVNLSSTQQVAALGALVCILQKHALLAPHSAVEGGDGPLCVIENISEVTDVG